MFQRGHIYTSAGSFFIEPVEEYTTNNQNILHKISREKLPLDKVSFDKHRNGKVLIDEMSVHEDEAEKIDDSIADDLNQEIEDEIDANETILNSYENCTTDDGKSKWKHIHYSVLLCCVWFVFIENSVLFFLQIFF